MDCSARVTRRRGRACPEKQDLGTSHERSHRIDEDEGLLRSLGGPGFNAP